MADDIVAPGLLAFPNGYKITVDEVWREQVLYCVWPPGVTGQGLFERTYRRPVAEFIRLVRENNGERADCRPFAGAAR